MPVGSFNVSALLRQLGHKNVIQMPVRDDIQATMPLASMAGQVPVHVGGCAVFGCFQTAIAAEGGALEVVCLDPGGGILQWIESSSGPFRLTIGTAPAVWLTGPTPAVPQHFTNDPTATTAQFGTVAILAFPTDIPYFIGGGAGGVPNSAFAPMYVPRGSRVLVQASAVNAIFAGNVGWCGIQATEGGE